MDDLNFIVESLRPLAVEIDSLHVDPANARTKHALDRIAASLRQYGQRKPVVANRAQGGKIEAGNGTFLAAKKLKWTHLAVVWVDDDAATAAAFGIADNRVGELSEWDPDALAQLQSVTGDMFTGFEPDELAAVLGTEPEKAPGGDAEPQIDKAEELRQKWNVETGQMWQLGEHRIICGDCTDKAVVDRVMGGEKADLLLTDPPYGMSLETDTTGRIPTSPLPGKDRGLHAHSKVIGDDKPFDRTSVLLDAKEEFWWGGDYYVDTLPNSGKDGSWIVWDKRKEGALDEMRGNSFELCWSKTKHKRELIRVTWIGVLGHDKKNDGELKFHPTQKSVKLIQCIVSDYSKMDDIVADPFSGSGTTLIACQNLSRKCRAVEISPAYVAVALQRFVDAFGIEPVLME